MALLLAAVDSLVDGLAGVGGRGELCGAGGGFGRGGGAVVELVLDGGEGELAFAGEDAGVAEVALDVGAVEEAGEEGVCEGVVGGQAGLVDALLEVEALLPLLLQNCPSQHITAINCGKVVYASSPTPKESLGAVAQPQ